MPLRDVDDRCPGVLRPYGAADGAIVRLRVPGGRVTTRDLVSVCELATQHGQPFVQLTSRANLQLRGLADPLPAAFVDAVADLGMLPSATHDRVRNIVASPGSSLDPLVAELDSAIVASSTSAALSGRWIFALAESRESMPSAPADVRYIHGAGGGGEVDVAGRTWPCPSERAAATLVAVAEDFVEMTRDADGRYWNVADLPDGHPFHARLDERARRAVAYAHDLHTALERGHGTSPDVSGQPLVVHLLLGMLDVAAAEALHAVAHDVVVTPERSLVVRALRDPSERAAAESTLSSAGFVTESRSARARFSACIGAPSCRRTDVATLALTRAAADAHDAERRPGESAPRVHVVGCDRACGHPAGPHRLVVAPGDVTDIIHPNDDDPNGPA